MKAKKNPFASWITLSALLVLCGPTSAGDVNDLLMLPENKIDIGIAALTFAKEFYPALNIASYSVKIDSLVEKVRSKTRGSLDPEYRIRVLNTLLFLDEGFHYDHESSSKGRSEIFFLNNLLDSKEGNCFSMPVLYLAVAQRLGYPVYPVDVPDHLFLRYVDPGFKEQNIEVTSGGGYVPNAIYVKDFSIGEKGRKNGSYLHTLTYREFLSHFLDVNAVTYARKGAMKKSISYTEKAIRLHPRFAGYYNNLSGGYHWMSRHTDGEEAARYIEKSKQYALKTQELGYVDPRDIPLGVNTRGQ
jgi:regulator of sirC expression with transglutaminase-like and TPR domain